MGRTNVAVFPLPVDAKANICDEVLETRNGITAFWIGVGCLYPRDLQVCNRGGTSFKSSKVDMFVGTDRMAFPYFIFEGSGFCEGVDLFFAPDSSIGELFTLDLFLLNKVDMV